MGQIPQAMFLDVDGTLVKEGCEGVDDKVASVQQICEYCGYYRDKILVAGDSENDRPMLEYFATATVFVFLASCYNIL